MYDVYSEFDIIQHQKHFVNYLEVIIHPDGKVQYAVPSHQQYLVKYAATLQNISIQEFEDSVPCEFYCNYLYYLAMITQCVIVWTQGYFGINITDAQKDVLDQFVELGLMRDTILKV